MMKRLKEIQLNNKMVNLMDRPIVIGHDVDKNDKIIHYILRVSSSIKHPGKSFELTLSKWQYLLFLFQRLNKRRLVKLIGAILLVWGLMVNNLPLFYLGGALSLICDVIWLIGGKGKNCVRDYAIAYALGLLIFGWHKGLFIGSAVLILYIYVLDPYYFFELNPGSGLNTDKIKCLKREEVKKKE
jgi:hypothetical protein